MKIGILSDLHLGYRQYGLVDRENDFYLQFHKCCAKLNEVDADIVIIAGDIFDKPNPSPKAIHEYMYGIGHLNSDIVVAIKGNHTMLMKKNHYSVDELMGEDNFEGYYLLEDESISTHDYAFQSNYDMEFNKWKNEPNIRIDGITYRPDSQIDEFLYIQQELAEKEEETSFRILVTHQAYQEYCGFFGTDLSIKDLCTEPYDLIINGHIHSHQVGVLEDGTIFLQPGSIERMNVAEALDESKNGKGIWVYDTDEESLVFYEVECDRKFIQGDINIVSEYQLDRVFEKLLDNINKLSQKPIVSLNYHDFIDKAYLIRDKIVSVSDKVLFNNSNIYNEVEEELFVEIQDGEIPTVLEALNMTNTGLTDDEKNLAIDIHNAFNNDSKDISKLLEDYRKKHYDNEPKLIDVEDIKLEIEEYEKYFDNL